MAQKVVIPKGLVNPNETTIVEIPNNLKNVGTVVARARPAGGTPQSPATPKLVKKRSYTRRTYPPKKHGKIMGMLHDEGTTFGGRDYDSEDDSPVKAQPARDPRYVYNEISQNDLSYAVGSYGKKGFNPELQSTLLGIDETNYSPFKEFRPAKASSRPNSPPVQPKSIKRYQSFDSPPGSYYKSEVTTSTPDEIQTEITEEESYLDYGDSSPSEERPCPTDCSSGAYQQFNESSSGAYQKFNTSGDLYGSQNLALSSSGGSPKASSSSGASPRCNRLSQREVLNSLGELEANELSQIMGDLSQFQSARRRLVFDASSLASPADVSSSLLSSQMGLCNNDGKRRRPFKTIIIPRGIINPNQHNVIEIPMTLDANSSLIVKATNDQNPCFSVEPYRGDINNLPIDRSSTSTDQRYYSSFYQESVNQLPQSTKTDFGVQTQNYDYGYPARSSTPFAPPQPPCFVPEAHSPLCPICSRASCKYMMNRAISNRLNCSTTPNFYSSSISPNSHYSNYGTSTSCGFSAAGYNGTCGINSTLLPSLQATRSENFSRSRERLEDEALNRLLANKIDKILKPILLSLVKITPEDEERELNQKCLGPVCATRPSCSSIQGKSSRECFKKSSNLASLGALLRNSGSDCDTRRDQYYPRKGNVSFDERASRCKDLNKGCTSNSSLCRH